LEFSKKRDERIDILRAIAILCIIIAHSNPNGLILQLRNFDVILMVFLMGASFFLSNRGKEIRYGNYIFKRFRRLILPTWIFLIIFFIVYYFLSIILGDKYYFSANEIVTSFTLTSGIGYVWIMRVFFIGAMVTPVLLFISNKVKRHSIFFLLLLIAYALYALLLSAGKYIPIDIAQNLFEYYILQGFGYSLVIALGIRLYTFRGNHLLIISFTFLCMFILLMIYHDFSSTQAYKYPPTIYYLSYGLFVSFILYYILKFDRIRNFFYKSPIIFLSHKSLDIYYCHVFPIYVIELFGKNIPLINYSFYTRLFFIIFCTAVLLCIKLLFLKAPNKIRNLSI